jgi:hypothetical protein
MELLFRRQMSEKSKPDILYFDIETTPELGVIWRPGKQHVGADQIIKRSQVMSVSWAWNTGRVKGRVFDLDKYDWYSKDDDADYKLVRDFEILTRNADVVVAHNGKKFDLAVMRRRLIKYGLPNFSPFLVDDTWILTKDIAFESHKLDDLGDFLNIGRKMPHGNGYEWWINVMRGDERMLNNMLKYNMVDVSRLRAIYQKIRPYVKTALNMSIYMQERGACRNCGKMNLQARGFTLTTVGKRRRYQCTACGHWQSEGKNLIKKSETYPR